MSMGVPFGGMAFGLFGFVFLIVFLGVIAVIVTVAVRAARQGVRNSGAPRLTVAARVVSKRAHTGGGVGDTASYTRYFATFEVASGDRMEFALSGGESGMLAEGDVGSLTFQGTRYLSFERQRNPQS